MGGHENSEAWKDIQSIDSIWLGKNNSVGIELHTAGYNGGGGDRYVGILQRSGKFDVNRYYEAANLGSNHVNSARFVTENSSIPGMHLVQEKGYPGYRWDVHWDPFSTAFRRTSKVARIINPIAGGYLEQAGAALSHKNEKLQKSGVQVREELKRAGIVPDREP